MKKIVSLLLSTVMILGVLFSLASCDEPTDPGAEISVYLGEEVFDFDPTDYYVNDNAEQVMTLLFEPLFYLNENGELCNGVAEEYEVDEAKRTIKITLRQTYWSDEVRVKASDFVYAWSEVLLSPNKPNAAAPLLYDIENAVAVKSGEKTYSDLAAIATGTYELTITYRMGADYNQLLKNLASIATAPLRQEIVSPNPTYWSKDISTIVTNGPFKIEMLDRDAGVFTLARNLGFHQSSSAENYTEHVTPASLINFNTVEGNKTLTYADIQNKTVFYMADATLADRAMNKANAKVIDDLSTYTYVFNTEKGIFADKDVRRALSMALDRNAIASAITFGKAATGFLPDKVASSVYGSSISNRLDADMTEAKKLIAAANLSPADMEFTLTINDDEQSIAIANLAVAAWEQLGFTVYIEKVSTVSNLVFDPNLGDKDAVRDDANNILGNRYITDSAIQYLVKEASYGNRKFDVIAVDWQMYSTDAFVALASLTSSMNGNGTDYTENSQGTARVGISGWSNINYDAYILSAFKAQTKAERQAALKEAEKILLDSCPVIPVVFNQNFAFISSELTSVNVSGLGNFALNKLNQNNYHQYLSTEE